MRLSRSVILFSWLARAVQECAAAFQPLPLPLRSLTTTSKPLFQINTQHLASSAASAIIEYDDFLPNPNPSLDALDVVRACMNTLIARADGGGLEVCFNFSSDRNRAALGGSLERFNEYANNPVFGFLVRCSDWRIISVGPMIAGTPNRGAMQTVLMDAIQTTRAAKSDNGERRFLWTLQQERRPPRQGCWLIHEVLYVKNAFELTL